MTATVSPANVTWRSAVSAFVFRHFPQARKTLWRAAYDAGARYMRADDLNFMNLGYAADDYQHQGAIPVDYFPRRLYDHVIGGTTLHGKDVLEVGCGRGGGAAHVHAAFSPKSLMGVDLALANIELCRERYPGAGLDFRVGDASSLPFGAGSFDAVINVESSHCYPSRAQFFAEVRRVLRPGGRFLFADLVWPFLDNVTMDALSQMLQQSGLIVLQAENITRNVLRSRTLMSGDAAFEGTLNRWSPPGALSTDKARAEGMFLRGSFHYECLSDGRAQYGRWLLENQP